MKNEVKHTAHSSYRCEYHLVFAPKYRRKVMLMVNKEAQQNRTRTVSPAAIPSKANYRVKSKKHL